ncbi:bestrophin-like domain [Streptomyces hydrogenans]|uniref:bestrophin-like domain n=1 Tax=Streptomyces hydrogenans TaxID=1873719 RepID=UPI00331FDFD7
MTMLLTVVIIAAALAVGLFANQVRRRRRAAAGGGDGEEASVSDLVSPLETLAVLLVAFVIVLAAESFGSAAAAVEAEAGRVDQLYEVADYAPEPQREHLQAAAVCYARAIQAAEWPLMAEGGEKSPVASVWSSGFRTHFKELAHRDDPTFDLLVEADDERSKARQTRISEASPAIPPSVYWFMVVALAATVGAFAFGLPRDRGPSHLTLLCVLAVLFTGSLLLIEDIDTPFSGQIKITSETMAQTAQDISEDYATDHPDGTLPCDAGGARV